MIEKQFALFLDFFILPALHSRTNLDSNCRDGHCPSAFCHESGWIGCSLPLEGKVAFA